MWAMLTISCQDLFKRYMHLDPGEMTQIWAIIYIPWGIKLLYGLISDNITLCGSKRKSYIVLMGLLQFFSLIYLYAFPDLSIFSVTLGLTLVSFSESFVNVVSYGLMVIQSRKDKENGS
jgi:hypothetical protein